MLKKMLRMLSKHEKGFTLVELMVVVVIIGVLTAIAIPVYNASTQKANTSACQANQRMVEGAIQQYKANNDGSIPANMTDLKDYFQTEPKCPSDKATYTWTTTGNDAGVVNCPSNIHPHFATVTPAPTP